MLVVNLEVMVSKSSIQMVWIIEHFFFFFLGFIDFYINGKLNWGIELLREGRDAEAHAQRFTPGGIYAKLRSKMQCFVLLDFRKSKAPKQKKKHFWYVVYSQDFKSVSICCHGREMKQIQLVGNTIQ
jgi:hypothetical protein